MHVAHIILASMLCIASEQTLFNKDGHGVTDVTVYSIPIHTTNIWFKQNSTRHIPAAFFQNLPYLDGIGLRRNRISSIDSYASWGQI